MIEHRPRLPSSEFDVLIVGAGPVGLALSIELGQRGVRCLVVEQNERVGYNPRAKTTNVRTREHLRRWRLDGALRAASPIPPDYPSDVVFATRIDGHVLARFENAFNTKPERNPLYSGRVRHRSPNMCWRKYCASMRPLFLRSRFASSANAKPSNRMRRAFAHRYSI